MARTLQQEGQLGLFKPESSWQPPKELPDLRRYDMIAMDTETKDDGLANGLGPGWAMKMGYICGVSYATEDHQGYIPLRHPESQNFDPDQVMRWVQDHFESEARVVFHNGPYDLGWLGVYGVGVPKNLEDTQAAAVMVDEARYSYSLDNCCKWQGVPGKDEQLLRDAVAAYGGNPKRPKGEIWRLPARYAGPYAEQDGVATLGLWRQLEPVMKAQEVWDAYRTEVDIIPLVVAMRRRGIRLDTDLATRTGKVFRQRRDEALAELHRHLSIGRAVTIEDIRSPKFLERVFQAEGVGYPMTESGKQGSFSSDWMDRHTHWLPRLVTTAIKYEDASTKFIDNYLLGFANRGRLHAEIHQFRDDSGGTRSHRFSYSEPPLQQMPSPDKDPRDELKQLIEDRAVGTPIRRCFLSEEGTGWLSADYSSQEPRLTVHFAALVKATGVQRIVDQYNENPRTDYHQAVAEMVKKPRPVAKILNLGMTYGKGKASLAEELGLPIDEAEVILKDYHERLPYIKSLEDKAKNLAQQRGYIRLIDGARMRYNDWEGPFLDRDVRKRAVLAGHKLTPCSREEAVERQANPEHPWHGKRLRRADTRKALNNLVQGSAARQTKMAMREMAREGILPLLQMHDEIAAPVSSRAEVERINEIMVNVVKLVVPVVVDCEVGPTWGEAKMSWDAYAAKYLKGAA